LKHIVLDTDPGVDDALAFLLAFNSPEIKVEAVTTVVGNVSHEKTHGNALKLMEFLGISDVPVAKGAEKPLLREPRHAEEVHGETGLGDAVLPEPKLKSHQKSAVNLILEKARELGKRLTLVAIGPLTNIAQAILVEPETVFETSGLVIMGGAFNVTPYGHGNVTPVAEFNIWHDPMAAKIVFDSGIPMTAVGLDVTTDPANRLSRDAFRELTRHQTRKTRLISDLCGGMVERYDGFSLHDPMAVGVTIDPRLARTERYTVNVETQSELTMGQTVIDRRGQAHRRLEGKPNVDICVSVESKRFLKLFSERAVQG